LGVRLKDAGGGPSGGIEKKEYTMRNLINKNKILTCQLFSGRDRIGLRRVIGRREAEAIHLIPLLLYSKKAFCLCSQPLVSDVMMW
jgi:hypothetical protein